MTSGQTVESPSGNGDSEDRWRNGRKKSSGGGDGDGEGNDDGSSGDDSSQRDRRRRKKDKSRRPRRDPFFFTILVPHRRALRHLREDLHPLVAGSLEGRIEVAEKLTIQECEDPCFRWYQQQVP